MEAGTQTIGIYDVGATNDGNFIGAGSDNRKETSSLYDDPFLADVWIGMILLLMAFMCVGYLFTCLLYHKFKRWKRQILEAQREAGSTALDDRYQYEESLPSYTIVTGLPSYDQAMEQFRQMRALRKASWPKMSITENDDQQQTTYSPSNNNNRLTFARLSLGEILQFYKTDKTLPV